MSIHKTRINKKTSSYARSHGAILIVSLMLLLVMTLVGIAAIDSSTLQIQMTRNSFFKQTLYQLTRSEIEAQLEKFKGIVYIQSIITAPKTNGTPTTTLSDSEVETHDGSDAYTQSATLIFSGDGAPPSGYSLGLFVGKNFQISPVSEVSGTGSKSDQTQGINYPAPI